MQDSSAAHAEPTPAGPSISTLALAVVAPFAAIAVLALPLFLELLKDAAVH